MTIGAPESLATRPEAADHYRWRPEIGLVVIQGYSSDRDATRLVDVVARICARLNSLMRDQGPVYRSYGNDGLLVKEHRVGERGREYEKDAYWKVLIQSREERHTQYVIGVCEHTLPESSFNLESRSDHVAVVSGAGYEDHKPPGLTYERYLMYLITCVTMLLQDPSIEEHDTTAGCLFDLCVEPRDLTLGLRRPSLEHCRDRQLRSWPNEVIDPYGRVLNDIGRRDPLAILTSALGNRGVGLLAGVLVAFVTHLVVAEWPRVAVVLVFVGVVAICAYGFLRLSARLPWVERHRRIVFWVVVAVGVVLAAGLAYVSVRETIPRLPTQDHATTCLRGAPAIRLGQSLGSQGSVVVECGDRTDFGHRKPGRD